MPKSYDFSDAKRVKDVPHLAKLQAKAQLNKTRVTMWIDSDVMKRSVCVPRKWGLDIKRKSIARCEMQC